MPPNTNPSLTSAATSVNSMISQPLVSQYGYSVAVNTAALAQLTPFLVRQSRIHPNILSALISGSQPLWTLRNHPEVQACLSVLGVAATDQDLITLLKSTQGVIPPNNANDLMSVELIRASIQNGEIDVEDAALPDAMRGLMATGWFGREDRHLRTQEPNQETVARMPIWYGMRVILHRFRDVRLGLRDIPVSDLMTMVAELKGLAVSIRRKSRVVLAGHQERTTLRRAARQLSSTCDMIQDGGLWQEGQHNWREKNKEFLQLIQDQGNFVAHIWSSAVIENGESISVR